MCDVPRPHNAPGVALRGTLPYREEHSRTAGQCLWPRVKSLVRVLGGQGLRYTTTRRYTPKAVAIAGAEDDHVIGRPGHRHQTSAESSNVHCLTAEDRNTLQRGVCFVEERDRVPVRGEHWVTPPFGAANGSDFDLIDMAQVEKTLKRHRIAGPVHDACPVRRNGNFRMFTNEQEPDWQRGDCETCRGPGRGSGPAIHTITPVTRTAVTAATQGNARRQPDEREVVNSALGTSGTDAVNASVISTRASPTCWSRSLRSLARHRRTSCLIAPGVLAGSRVRSGSRSSTCARVSLTVAPSKGLCPTSIS